MSARATSRSFILCAGAIFAALAGCATGSAVRASAIDSLARLGSSALAREVQRDAPEAYAEFARMLRAAESATGEARAAKEREAELVLAWAATQARVARARERQRAAEARDEAARAERTRVEARVTELDRESEAREQALAALTRSGALADGPTQTEAIGRELRQQARLALAAAAMMGASEEQRARVQAMIDEAERSQGAAQWASSGRAMRAAEALVRAARAGREPASSALVDSVGGGEDPVAPRREARGVVLSLRALFDGRGALVATASGRLSVVAQALRSHPQMRARVEAYVGGADATRAQRSATERARLVKDALVARGIEAQRIEAEGLVRVQGGERSEDLVEVVLLSGP